MLLPAPFTLRPIQGYLRSRSMVKSGNRPCPAHRPVKFPVFVVLIRVSQDCAGIGAFPFRLFGYVYASQKCSPPLIIPCSGMLEMVVRLEGEGLGPTPCITCLFSPAGVLVLYVHTNIKPTTGVRESERKAGRSPSPRSKVAVLSTFCHFWPCTVERDAWAATTPR